MFPGFSREAIVADLQRTGAAELTIENIIEGRLVAPELEEDVVRFPNVVDRDSDHEGLDAAQEEEDGPPLPPLEPDDGVYLSDRSSDEENSLMQEINAKTEESVEEETPAVAELSIEQRRELALMAALKRSQEEQ